MPDTPNPILIRHIAPKNFLSFGPDNAGIKLQSLNLFIGPNGSGKSNLIEVISLTVSWEGNAGEWLVGERHFVLRMRRKGLR